MLFDLYTSSPVPTISVSILSHNHALKCTTLCSVIVKGRLASHDRLIHPTRGLQQPCHVNPPPQEILKKRKRYNQLPLASLLYVLRRDSLNALSLSPDCRDNQHCTNRRLAHRRGRLQRTDQVRTGLASTGIIACATRPNPSTKGDPCSTEP